MRGMENHLGKLWRGQLPLEIAFWHYAIYYGLIVNVLATTLSIILILLDASIIWAVLVHVLPLPYSFIAAYGVWRSANRYAGKPAFANFARIGVLAWFCFWMAV
jgi:hypothetical protein